MKHTLTYGLAAAFACTLIALSSRSAISSGQGAAIVRLQTATPGAAQSGHSHITGKVKAGGLEIFDSRSLGVSLTSDTISFASATSEDPAYRYTYSPEQHEFFVAGSLVLTLSASGPVGSGAGLTGVNADLLDGLNSTAFLQSVPSPLSLVGSNPGIGTISGENSSTPGHGVFGKATATSGNANGGRFETNSATGNGVYGYALSTSGICQGVFGRTDSTAGRAVYGFASSSSGTTYGVFGFAPVSGSGAAVFAQGDMVASGTKPFRIDHPSDPLNKYLFHYATESPSPQNSYSGNVTTDGKGYAWIELPDYFQDINANFKYQLTVVDTSDSDEFIWVKVVAEVQANYFRIRSNKAGVKVSWRVEADRNDHYVQYKKPKEVVEKQGVERGKYQHPELYDAPPEMGMNYQPSLAKAGNNP